MSKTQSIKLTNANIVTAFSDKAIGTRVVKDTLFNEIVIEAIKNHDWSPKEGSTPGQEFIMLPDTAIETVSAGVGKRTDNPCDYVIREHRGRVSAFLRRELAAEATGVAVVVYTLQAYLADPDIQKDFAEGARVVQISATHVVVAVLAFAGPKAPLTPYRLVSNLAGGNKDTMEWSVSILRKRAKESIEYDNEWAVVAD